MRSKLLQDTDKRLRLTTFDRIAIMAVATAVIVSLILLFSTLNTILMNQSDDAIRDTDILNKLNQMDVEDEQAQVDIELIERVVAAEARGESLQGQMAVAQTILDRSELWGMTPTEVVLEEGQYAEPYQGEIPDSVKLAVANVFCGDMRVFEEPTTHFASNEPYWTENKVNRGSVGIHTFYY